MGGQITSSNAACTGGGVSIKGAGKLDPFLWREPNMNSIASAVLPTSDNDIYDLLMGISGMAFRIQTLPREIWCPSCMNSRFGFNALDHLSATAHKIGMTIKKIDAGTTSQQHLNEKLTGSIDRGFCLSANGSWWIGIICGYQQCDDGTLQLQIITHDHSPDNPLVTSEFASSIITIEGKPQYPDAETVKDSLRLAVQLSARDDSPCMYGEYNNGTAAWKEWEDSLQVDWDSEGYNELVAAHQEDGGISECHRRNMAWLANSRTSAAVYLETIMELFPESDAALLQKAAESYSNIGRLLGDAYKTQQWNAQGRALLSHALSRASEHEETALDMIRRII